MVPRRLVLPAVALLVAGALSQAHAAPTPPDPGGAIVVAAGGATAGYTTKVAVAVPGTPLTFYNFDGIPHTVVSVDRDADGNRLFEGNALQSSWSVVKGVDRLRPGSYAFFCSFHPNMTGTLVVQGGSGAAAPAKPRFLQPLRIPRQVTGSRITLVAQQADVQILPGKPPTTMLTYGGSWPGPTIRRPVGQRTSVTVVNQLPEAFGETSLHLHGDHHSSADDGQPMSQLIPPGGRKTYTFPLTDGGRPERAMFSFYHDHRMDHTGRNNWYGLQGMVITDDPKEKRLGLPDGAYDVPLLVADRTLDADAQLVNPDPVKDDSLTGGVDGPGVPPGDATTGDRTLVNGQFQPYASVATHRYRLRLLNASPFTSYDFRFSDGRPMVQVGNGSALLPTPVTRTDILLGPAERADVVVDFGRDLGRSVVLESVQRTDTRPGGIGTPASPVMQFRVTKRVVDRSRVPKALVPLPPLAVPAAPTQTFVFALGADAAGLRTRWTINGKPYDPSRVDATVELGSVQRWRLVNASTITHFIHLHEEAWRTVSRNGLAPPAWEAGYQDVWRLDPGDTVDVAARVTDYLGPFLIHCHMLDHEDHGMMATFQVVKPGTANAPLPVSAPATAHAHPAPPGSLAALAASSWCRNPDLRAREERRS